MGSRSRCSEISLRQGKTWHPHTVTTGQRPSPAPRWASPALTRERKEDTRPVQVPPQADTPRPPEGGTAGSWWSPKAKVGARDVVLSTSHLALGRGCGVPAGCSKVTFTPLVKELRGRETLPCPGFAAPPSCGLAPPSPTHELLCPCSCQNALHLENSYSYFNTRSPPPPSSTPALRHPPPSPQGDCPALWPACSCQVYSSHSTALGRAAGLFLSSANQPPSPATAAVTPRETLVFQPR